jgi:hypothetical protein
MSTEGASAAAGQGRVQLAAHWQMLQRDLAASLAAPSSLRKAWLVAVLIDHLPDRLWQACTEAGRPPPGGAPDLLAYRAQLRSGSPALAEVFALVAMEPDGPRLQLLPVAVPPDAVAALPVEDFMVSLYNNHHVQRLLLTTPSSTSPAHAQLTAAVADLAGEMAAFGL